MNNNKVFEPISIFDKYRNTREELDIDINSKSNRDLDIVKLMQKYSSKEKVHANSIEEYNNLIADKYEKCRKELIDLIPKFSLVIDADADNDKVAFRFEINSVFDIAYLELARNIIDYDPFRDNKNKQELKEENIKRNEERQCPICGDLYKPNGNRQKLCGKDKCFKIYNANRQRIFYKKNKISRKKEKLC